MDIEAAAGAPSEVPAAAKPQQPAVPLWRRLQRAERDMALASECSGCKGSATEYDLAPLTSRKLLRFFKAFAFLSLLATAGVGAGVAYRLGHDAETRMFRVQFDASAAQLHTNLQANLNNQARSLGWRWRVTSATMCARFLSTFSDPVITRGTTRRYFDEFAADLQNITRTSEFARLELVNETQRHAFEAAAVDTAQLLDASGALAARVRSSGIRAFAADANLSAMPPPSALVRAPPAPLYAVVWNSAPQRSKSELFLLDALSEPMRRDALQRVIATGALAMTEPTTFTYADQPGTATPSAVIFAPAHSQLNANRTYAPLNAAAAGDAICGVSFHFDAVLRDALPSFVTAIVAVLRSPRGAEFTFRIWGGAVFGIEPGDESSHLASRFAHLRRQADVYAADSTWRLTLYPTEELRNRYMTDKPRDYALGIAAAGVVCAALFMHCCTWFEFFDRDRIKRINARLCAYVADLEAMQRRLEEGSAREAEAKARALAEEASSRQKDSFVAMVSHEIRTPLNAISGAAALLAATSLDTEQRELVTLLETGTAHVVLIVEDILIAGALASGAFAVARERLQLRTAVLDPAWRMIQMQRSQQEKLRSLRLTRTVAPDVPQEVVGDSTRLTQVLTNTLSNSLKFTQAGGAITLAVDTTDEPPASWKPSSPDAEQPARWLRFRVIDSGIGLCAENLERIFQPFVQAEQSTVRQYGGTGLGLTICRRIARVMGGDLTASSEGLGKGCTLTFIIPLCEPSAADSAAAAGAADTAAVGSHSGGGALEGGGEITPWVAEPAAPPSPLQPPPARLPPMRLPSPAASPPPSPEASQSPVSPSPPPSPSASQLSSAPSPPASPTAPRAPLALDPGAPSVLVAEDDQLSQTVMRKLLSALRLRFTLVGNGAAAVEAYKQETFDLVLMDLHMPILDGLAATRAIRELVASGERPPAPIVALTASCSEQERQRCAAAGMAELMPKPVRLDSLRRLLQRYARGARQEAT